MGDFMKKMLILCTMICSLFANTTYSSDSDTLQPFLDTGFVTLEVLPKSTTPDLINLNFSNITTATSRHNEFFEKPPLDTSFDNLSMSDEFDSNYKPKPITLPTGWTVPAHELKTLFNDSTIAKLDTMIAEIETERGEFNINILELPLYYLIERWHVYLRNPFYRQKIQQKLSTQYRNLSNDHEKSYVIRTLAERNKQNFAAFEQAQKKAMHKFQEKPTEKLAKKAAQAELRQVLDAYKAFEE